jgi:hypothetical protein
MMGKKKSERKGREALEEKLEKLGRKLEKVVQERAELMRSLRPALVGPAAEAESGEDAPSAWLSADSMEQRERGTAVPACTRPCARVARSSGLRTTAFPGKPSSVFWTRLCTRRTTT